VCCRAGVACRMSASYINHRALVDRARVHLLRYCLP
jgi:hypothetical protein